MSARPQADIDVMLAMRARGATLQQIGDRFGFTRERARQYLAVEGVTGRLWRGWQITHYRRLAAAVGQIARHIVRTAKPDDLYFPHGTLRGYRRGCSCGECRRANREAVYAVTGYVPKQPRPDWERTRRAPGEWL